MDLIRTVANDSLVIQKFHYLTLSVSSARIATLSICLSRFSSSVFWKHTESRFSSFVRQQHLFIIGFFFASIPWYVDTFIVLYARVDYREKPGFIACTFA
ncbi:hypothetical protein H6P81_019017 [Aristolochia fimbriata]|uniref:Uncharacterized protein n=1 Tax=Aristolochia fimbriata TaxID=158543 RepID=A0AAV7E724_ARIFI|nr:hypothetical protein H6P81_019017 [Aristolochia fimbriata]